MITKELKSTKAITLIAMVISILVLLILAGVSVSLVVGETGITQRAVTAKKTYDIAGAKEKLELQIAGYAGDFYQDKYVNGSIGASENVGGYVLGKFTNGSDFEGDYTLTKDGNEITITNKKDASQSATATIDDNGKVSWSGTVTEAVAIWTQDGTSVTNGEVTLTVGQAVTGYSVDVEINDATQTVSNWYVLGAEEGKLLITTNTCPEKVTLEGKDGYTGGVATLNSATTKYSDGDFADSVRSINVDDINRVTGYVPELVGYASGGVCEYGNQVTFTLKDGSVWYQGIKQPISMNKSMSHICEYWNGAFWSTLEEGQSVTLESTNYEYYPNTLTEESEGDSNGISTEGLAYSLLFDNTGIDLGWTTTSQDEYWLSSSCVETHGNEYAAWIFYSLRSVKKERVEQAALFKSDDASVFDQTRGLRPVISLKFTVKVTDEGVLSK